MDGIKNFEEKFLAFAKKQSGKYNPCDLHNCALGQFVASEGFEGGSVQYWGSLNGAYCIAGDYPKRAMRAALPRKGEYTWEALVRRMEA